MKYLFTFFSLLLVAYTLNAQSPEGIIYQAEARDNYGNLLANESLDVKITILQDSSSGIVVWEGKHSVTTNKYGMFVLVIGNGENTMNYSFDAIDWGSHTHFLNVQIKKSLEANWINMGTSQFLSVPYALYAKSAGSIVNEEVLDLKSASTGVPSQTWSLFGNSKSDPATDKLGTTDNADLVLVTNDEERMRILSDGDIKLSNSLEIGDDLTAKQNVYLNTEGGETVNNGELTVANESSTTLTGKLTVDKETQLNNALTVENESPTVLTGSLTVNKDVELDHDLQVANDVNIGNNTTIQNDLAVNHDLLVNNTTRTSQLEVKKDVSDGAFLATFENTNTGNGDGIKIKLGKKKTNNHIAEMPDVLSQSEVEDIKNLLNCNLSALDKVNLLGKITAEGIKADVQMIGGLTVGIGNLVVGFINTQLSLPIQFPTTEIVPSVTTFPAIDYSLGSIAGYDLPTIHLSGHSIGPYSLPGFTMVSKIPTINLSDLGIDAINLKDAAFWGLPNICFDGNESGVLNNDNEFIQFADNTDTKMGAIRAVSVNDWTKNYLNPVFLFKLRGALTSAVDKLHARYHFRSQITEALKNYASIGVEYSSGNGDYAEWLERINPQEEIGTGDIVGVVGSKITKDLTSAEQVMAVSYHPIVLGNTPPEGKTYLGNNIAFMGQIPVKVMGPVKTGDYIVGKGQIKGYGVAVNPADMTIDDFKHAVGRAWEENLSSGPKMVNTVVGVHNGDYLHILKNLNQRIESSEQRLESLENKVNQLTGVAMQK